MEDRMGERHGRAPPSEAATEEEAEEAESLRLALALQQEEEAALQQQFALQRPNFEADESLDDETRQSLELAWRMQMEEQQRMQEQADAVERLAGEPEDQDSIALAIRLQQEDDESALRNALGVQEGEDGEPVSPSQYSYEQLMRLQDTVGMVSKGASADAIDALRTLTVQEARADSTILLSEKCSVCQEEFQSQDVLRLLDCHHAFHAECVDPWLKDHNKTCPLCHAEVKLSLPTPSKDTVSVPMELTSPSASTPMELASPMVPSAAAMSAAEPLADANTNVAQAAVPSGICGHE